MTMGKLTLVGVSPLSQHRTCVTGHSCLIDEIKGNFLSSSDKMLLLETCGTSSLAPRVIASSLFTSTATSSGQATRGNNEFGGSPRRGAKGTLQGLRIIILNCSCIG